MIKNCMNFCFLKKTFLRTSVLVCGPILVMSSQGFLSQGGATSGATPADLFAEWHDSKAILIHKLTNKHSTQCFLRW